MAGQKGYTGEAPYNMNGTAKAPSANYLFNVNDGAKSWHTIKQNYSTRWWQNYCTCAGEHVRTYRPL